MLSFFPCPLPTYFSFLAPETIPYPIFLLVFLQFFHPASDLKRRLVQRTFIHRFSQILNPYHLS